MGFRIRLLQFRPGGGIGDSQSLRPLHDGIDWGGSGVIFVDMELDNDGNGEAPTGDIARIINDLFYRGLLKALQTPFIHTA